MLFLDFDGVICDSLNECLFSSWLAYYTLFKKEQPTLVPVTLKKEFSRLRPYVRSGEDYLLIHQLFEEGKASGDQSDFDRQVAQAGTKRMQLYKELLYAVREDLLLHEKEYWLALNPLYGHMLEPLRKIYPKNNVHIISTKKPRPIMEILQAHAIDFPAERVHYAANKGKRELITGIMARYGQKHAIFIDDQISQLKQVQADNIELYLALWGYVQPAWLADLGQVKTLTAEEAVSLFSRFY